MSLCFSSSRGEVEQRWIVYALLRDNVQHHLEHGLPSAEFQEIHGAARALGGGRVVLSAPRLRSELEKAQAALARRPFSELAISAHTRAAIDGRWPPESDSTTLVGQDWRAIPWLRAEMGTLDQVFGSLIRRLLDITAGALEGDRVEVTDL